VIKHICDKCKKEIEQYIPDVNDVGTRGYFAGQGNIGGHLCNKCCEALKKWFGFMI